MILQIKKDGSNEWQTLRNTVGIGTIGDDAYKYLMGQQNDWIQNGGPDYVSAQYRIGDFRRNESTGNYDAFSDYTPMIQRSFS